MLQIKKRDGRIVIFDAQKIIDAVLAAFKEVDGYVSDYALDKAENIANFIEGIAENLEEDDVLTIEQIQDYVENGLQSTKRKDVAKAYILYRNERAKSRLKETSFIKSFEEKLLAENLVNQNANVDEASFGGRKGEASNVVMKKYALDYCMSQKSKENHLNNRIYIHDLDSYAVGQHNCLSIPFDDLLAKGFSTRQTDVRPAQSIRTAFQLLAVIFQIQSLQQFGGCSATHLDWTMVPYVRKSFYKHYLDGLKYIESAKAGHEIKIALDINDNIPIDNTKIYSYPQVYDYAMDMTVKEIQQAVEGMYHNLR